MTRRTRRSSTPPVHRPTRPVGGVVLAILVFCGGVFAASVLSPAAPAAERDCLPLVGCVTTVLPSVPLPTVTVPTTPTTGTTGSTTTGPTSPPTTVPEKPAATDRAAAVPSPKAGAAMLTAAGSARVRGSGARRVVEIKVRLSKRATVQAVVRRGPAVLAKGSFQARSGANVLRLRVPLTVKPGRATVALTFRSSAGELRRMACRLVLGR